MEGPLKMRAALAAGLAMAVLALISACSSTKELPLPNQKPNTPQAFAQWYQDCWSDFNAQRWDDFKKCYAPDATSEQPGYGKLSVSGPDAIVKASQDFMRTFPDARGEGQLILVNGNRITSFYLLKGTNSGPLVGPDGKELPGRNQKIGLFFGHSIELDPDVRVAREIGVMDGITLENQMGLLKMPGRPRADSGVPTPVVVTAMNDAMEMKNVDTLNMYLADWNKHDGPAVDMYEAADYVLHNLAEPTNRNKTQTAQMNKSYWQGFSDAKINIRSLWGAGNYVSLTGTFDGDNDGDFPLLKAKKTGKKISIPFVDIFRLDGGKIKEEWLFFDGASLVTQLRSK